MALAYKMIQHNGLRPEFDIGIEMSQHILGETIHEKIFADNETILPSRKQGVACAELPIHEHRHRESLLHRLIKVARDYNDFETQKLLAQLSEIV